MQSLFSADCSYSTAKNMKPSQVSQEMFQPLCDALSFIT